ncbi:hypothetical protein, partial [Ileibacterium valens]
LLTYKSPKLLTFLLTTNMPQQTGQRTEQRMEQRRNRGKLLKPLKLLKNVEEITLVMLFPDDL